MLANTTRSCIANSETRQLRPRAFRDITTRQGRTATVSSPVTTARSSSLASRRAFVERSDVQDGHAFTAAVAHRAGRHQLTSRRAAVQEHVMLLDAMLVEYRLTLRDTGPRAVLQDVPLVRLAHARQRCTTVREPVDGGLVSRSVSAEPEPAQIAHTRSDSPPRRIGDLVAVP